MQNIAVKDLERNFAHYWSSVKQGETLLITDNNVVIAELKPLSTPKLPEVRPQGLAKGLFKVPNNFNEPLPDDLLSEFYK